MPSLDLQNTLDLDQYTPRTSQNLDLLAQLEFFVKRELGRRKGLKLLSEINEKTEEWHTIAPQSDLSGDEKEQDEAECIEKLRDLKDILSNGVKDCLSLYYLDEIEVETRAEDCS